MRAGWRLVVIAAAIMAMGRPVAAFHTVFDFTIDHFEADGNEYGPFDGVPDYVSEFNTDMYTWGTPYGSSSVSGGRLHVQSPGTHLPGPDGSTLDLTEVTSSRYVFKGHGDFAATAVFDSIIPPEGHFYHFTIYTFGGGTYFSEIFGIDVQTIGGETRIEQHMVVLDLTHGIYQTVTTEWRTITAADLAPQSVFRLLYDDATGTIHSAFSLDGGATFESPFTPVPIFTEGRSSGLFILGADPHLGVSTTSTTSTTSSTSTTDGGPLASTTTTTTLPAGVCERTDCSAAPDDRLSVRVGGNGQRVTWTWKHGPAMPLAVLGSPTSAGGAPYSLCIRDAHGAVIVHDELPTGGLCSGRPCWRALGSRGFGFKDARGGDGVTALRVLVGGRSGSQVTAKMKGASLFSSLPPAAPLTAQLEAGDGACFTSSIDASAVVTRRVRRRPPPPPGY
jgi:hypothetical protein